MRSFGSGMPTKDIFVPEHRTVAIDAVKGGAHPGAAANPGAIFRIPVFAALPQMLIGIPLGIAQGAYEVFLEGMRGRVSRYSGKSVADMTAVQMKVADAGACVDTARLVLRHQCATAQAIAERGEAPDLLTKATWRRDGAFAAQLCGRAVTIVVSEAADEERMKSEKGLWRLARF